MTTTAAGLCLNATLNWECFSMLSLGSDKYGIKLAVIYTSAIQAALKKQIPWIP